MSNGDLAGKLHGNHLTVHSKKQGVSGESSHLDGRNMTVTAPKFEKDFRSKQLIKEAIMDNDFLKKLDSSQLREIVDSMYPKKYANGTFIIREGEVGSHLFVAAEGQMEVIKEGQVLGQMGPGKAFGELAILYNCTRTASVKAVTDVHVWELERRVFQTVMMRTAIRRLEDNLSFLRSVPLLAKLSRDKLVKMADVIETETYAPGAYIIRQGTSGDGFYIISSGSVKVTQRSPDGVEDEIRTLKAGEYFGEQALLKEDKRTANIIAQPPSVTVLALDRTSFARLIGDLQELRDLKYEERPVSRTSSAQSARLPNEFSHLTLDSLDIIATLGIGGFGRVELVQSASEPGKTLALKCLKKHYIVETQQQEHVHSEKEIMLRCNHQFIVRLYKTFKDSKYVYLLMDACLGGEVWSILRDRGQFDSEACRFYTACVVEALEYLHTRHIVYRDLKPENLLLDTEGYCKLTDFGFSKELRSHGKTWTFCGTPEYVSPEVILNKGHDRAVDYWSLGVLMYELYTGAPPFSASDPMKTYNIILKGIDIIDFPRNIPRSGEQLIKRLCRDVPTERLGYQRNGVEDIRKHRWFQGFDWEGLRSRQLAPPIIPQVKGPTDASNFDCYSRDLETPPDELSGWDEDF
ncbi:cGMP-dependent protein kinase, isozyme 1-like [Amphibalanus amphitrite]|nr:cGMP-dependent protein kinase, isozyme 1-like [Amphibalanus amphitrite]